MRENGRDCQLIHYEHSETEKGGKGETVAHKQKKNGTQKVYVTMGGKVDVRWYCEVTWKK